MTEAILVFSLGPVQGFIAEARRIADLDAGSHLLVELSTAAGSAIQDEGGQLIFPSELSDDVPNKLVARVPADKVEKVAEAASNAVRSRWSVFAGRASRFLADVGPVPDSVWEEIWNRQISHQWEIYWAAAPENDDYHSAYDTVSRAFDATKRTHAFPQIAERGEKDSLSGRRSALRLGDMSARDYWTEVSKSPRVTQAELRSDGRERLDAIGAIKRWGGLAEGAPSVSLIAAADFITAAKEDRPALAMYRGIIESESLLGEYLFPVSSDSDWPYGGDLFYLDTLTPDRLAESYGLKGIEEADLEVSRQMLKSLHQAVGMTPRSYYAIIALDGDGMGEMVNKCQTESEHQSLSGRILAFSKKVRPVVERHLGHTVYAGGDDVLALVPLATALPLAQELASEFESDVGGTASAGIAIVHRLYPLSAALGAARGAEREAKQVPGKAAVCVRAIRRSGETTDTLGSWDAIDGNLEQVIDLFQSAVLSSKFAYAVAEAAYGLPIPDESLEAELRRLLSRHHDPAQWTESEEEWATRLRTWAENLPGEEKSAMLGRWLILARFLAQGGAE
jgi:CRISPR-associated protein Cmr2